MAVLDRYFIKIECKPLPIANATFLVIGFFDAKNDLASILTTMGKRVSSVSDAHITIFNTLGHVAKEQVNISFYGKGKGEFQGEKFDFSHDADTIQFIHKYFDISEESIHPARSHYFAEFVLHSETSEYKDTVILAYFSCASEFVDILLEVGKKIKTDGNVQVNISNLNRPLKPLVATGYKFYKDGKVLVPDLDTHYISWKSKEDVQSYSLFLWETTLTQT